MNDALPTPRRPAPPVESRYSLGEVLPRPSPSNPEKRMREVEARAENFVRKQRGTQYGTREYAPDWYAARDGARGPGSSGQLVRTTRLFPGAQRLGTQRVLVRSDARTDTEYAPDWYTVRRPDTQRGTSTRTQSRVDDLIGYIENVNDDRQRRGADPVIHKLVGPSLARAVKPTKHQEGREQAAFFLRLANDAMRPLTCRCPATQENGSSSRMLWSAAGDLRNSPS